MHGDEDPGVPLQQSIEFQDRLRENGVPSTLKVIEEAEHGGKLFDTPEIRETVLQFFDRHLKHT